MQQARTAFGAIVAVVLMTAVVLLISRMVVNDPDQPERPPSTQLPRAPGVPEPGTVGYLGDPGQLRVLGRGAALPPGTSWNSTYNFLHVEAENLTLDGVYVKGGIDFDGRGSLRVTNSVIEGGWGAWFVILGRRAGATIEVQDSTLRWQPGSTPTADSGNGAIQVLDKLRVLASRNDISGTADGIQLAGDQSRVEQNWIHHLALVGDHVVGTHNDGVQVFHGQDIVIAENRIDLGFDGVHQNAAVFLQPGEGAAIRGIVIRGNYLRGGGYPLRLEGKGTTDAVITGNEFGELEPAAFGFASATEGATIRQWDENRRQTGGLVPQPACPRPSSVSSSGDRPSDAKCAPTSVR